MDNVHFSHASQGGYAYTPGLHEPELQDHDDAHDGAHEAAAPTSLQEVLRTTGNLRTLPKAATTLHAVVLASEVNVPFTEPALRELAAAEQERHARLALTGHAYFHDGRLIEYIEGPAESIDALIAARQADPRFTPRHTVRHETLAARRFTGSHLDTSTDDELMDLRLEHVLEALLQNFASSLFGQERTQSAIWRLVEAIARRQAKAADKAASRRATRLVMAH